MINATSVGPTIYNMNLDTFVGPTLYNVNNDTFVGPTIYNMNLDTFVGPTLSTPARKHRTMESGVTNQHILGDQVHVYTSKTVTYTKSSV